EDGIRSLIVTGVQTCALPILVTINVYTGFATHARTPVRSACTRKPVASPQNGGSSRKTITLPPERAASADTAAGSAESVSCPLVGTAGSLAFVLVRVSGAIARAASTSTAAPAAVTAPSGSGIASTTPSAMTSSVMTGADQ